MTQFTGREGAADYDSTEAVRPGPQDSGRPEDPGTYLPTEAELLTGTLQEHRELWAAEVRRHLSNMEAEIRRHREALAHYDHVFSLRLTGATRENPDGTAREGI